MDNQDTEARHWLGHETWPLAEEEAQFPWLVDSSGTLRHLFLNTSRCNQPFVSLVVVEKILNAPSIGAEAWLTSDGRAYLVRLADEAEIDPDGDLNADKHKAGMIWQGTCVHDVYPPRWVEKLPQRGPSEIGTQPLAYDEPRKALSLAINVKFSLLAVGTSRYATYDCKSPFLGLIHRRIQRHR